MIQPPLPGFLPKSTWKDLPLPTFRPGVPISIDTETCDPGLKKRGPGGWRKEGFIVGVAVACGDKAYYTPVGKQGLREWLKATANAASQVVFANASYDLEWLESGLGVDLSGHPIHDIQIAEPLLDSGRQSYSLEALSLDYLGIGKDEELLKDALSAYGLRGKDELWKLPQEYIGPYAEIDVRRTLDVWIRQMEKIRENGLVAIYELERKVIPILHRMRRRGVKIDQDAVARLRDELVSKERALRDMLSGINVNSPHDLQRLCDSQGIPYNILLSGRPSFDKTWLQEAAKTYPVVKQIADLRSVEKIRSSFIDAAILESVDSKGIIRCTFHQLRDPDGGTITGRMSASRPNLQQVPGRSELGKKVRKCFVPPNGGQWLKMDYSQQEPRLLTHFACVTKLSGAKEVAQAYRDGKDIYSYIMEAVGISRDTSKTVTLGLIYGMGDELLAEKLNISKTEASSIRERLYVRVPFMQRITQDVSQVAATRGYIKTLLGRHQRFDEWEPNYSPKGTVPIKGLDRAREIWKDRGLRRAWTHTALNSLIQGSAADMTKKAMTEMPDNMMLAVHDELGCEIFDPAEAVEIKRIAEECVKLELPIRADIKIGRSWGG